MGDEKSALASVLLVAAKVAEESDGIQAAVTGLRHCLAIDSSKTFTDDLATCLREIARRVSGLEMSTCINVDGCLAFDGDGAVITFNTPYWIGPGNMVEVVAVSHKGKVCVRPWESRDTGKGGRWVKASTLTNVEPEQDTWRKIIEDAGAHVGWGDVDEGMRVGELVRRCEALAASHG